MIAGVVVASEGVVGWVRVKVTRGVLAGLAPAARAMSIKPVDAMRDE